MVTFAPLDCLDYVRTQLALDLVGELLHLVYEHLGFGRQLVQPAQLLG
jgi:hypothetical protein